MTESDAIDAAVPASQATLEFLLRRMRRQADFPALSESVVSIQRLAASELESVGGLTQEILKDVALTHKLLRMVNTAYYRRAGGGTISTVSRAIALIGFAGVRNLALSAVLVEHMENKSHAQHLKEEFLRTLMAGTLASELSMVARESEEAFITAVFQHLGRLLAEFYLPEEAAQIRQRLHAAPADSASRPSEFTVSASVLGISFEDLGIGVGRQWGLPDSLLHNMRAPQGTPPLEPPRDAGDRLRWLAAASGEVAQAMLYHEGPAAAQRIEALAQRYGRCLGLDVQVLDQAIARSRERMTDISNALQLRWREGEAVRRLLAPTPAPTEASARETVPAPALATDEFALPFLASGSPQTMADDPEGVLTAGIQDITNAMVENMRLNEVLRMILETMYRALSFRRVLFCLRDPRGQVLQGRFGLGEDALSLAPQFRVPLQLPAGAPVDLFSAVCLKGADTMIADASAPAIATRLPPWFRDHVNAPTFLLLPMLLKNGRQEQVIGLIYADRAQAGEIALSDKQLSLLRTLRNQAVMAFRQAAG